MISWQKKNGKNDEIGDNLDELWGEAEQTDSNPSEEWLEEEQQPEEAEDNENRQHKCEPRKQLTCTRNVHNIESSVDESN